MKKWSWWQWRPWCPIMYGKPLRMMAAVVVASIMSSLRPSSCFSSFVFPEDYKKSFKWTQFVLICFQWFTHSPPGTNPWRKGCRIMASNYQLGDLASNPPGMNYAPSMPILACQIFHCLCLSGFLSDHCPALSVTIVTILRLDVTLVVQGILCLCPVIWTV